MAKHKVIKSGTRADGSFWARIDKIEGEITLRCFIATTKLKVEGSDLVLPDSIKIPWSF